MTQDPEIKGAEPAANRRWHAPLPERLPEPTAWPLVLALGASLMAWGLVTSWIISGVGLMLFAAGMGGWIAGMRHEQPK